MNSNKINILYLIDKMEFGGAERQLVELLKGINKEKYNPCMAYFRKSPGFIDDVNELNIPIYFIERKWRWDPFVIWNLLLFIRQNHIDLVHSYMPVAGVYGPFSSKLSCLPIVNSFVRGTKQPTLYEKLLLKPSFALSDVIIANSEAGKRVYGKYSPLKMRVIYNGIDLMRFNNRIDREMKKISLNLQRFDSIVSMVTRLEPVKNPMMLIKAATIVLKDKPNTAFLIVGDGTLREEMELEVIDRALNRNVFFLGFRKDVEELLQITDIGVLTSDREGLPNAVIEMLASGVPVVATDCEGTREVLDDGLTGFLTDIGDEYGVAQRIVRLLGDDTLRRRMGVRGKDKVYKEFNLRKMVDALENIYCEVLGY
ncbi:MAG: glycosyltransferase [Proteobacteria bacterium]|nr:glycosyltransferase [Pseudomonadota bacterium]